MAVASWKVLKEFIAASCLSQVLWAKAAETNLNTSGEVFWNILTATKEEEEYFLPTVPLLSGPKSDFKLNLSFLTQLEIVARFDYDF